MIPHPNITFGAGALSSTLSPIGLVAMLIAIVMLLVMPRRWAIVPFLLFAYLVPLGQQIYLGGIHLFAIRIVILCGCLRFLVASRSYPVLKGGFTRIDKAFLFCMLCQTTAFVLLYREGAAVINQGGFLWDVLGGYFLIRCLVRDRRDIILIAKVFVVIAVIMAGCMLYEHYRVENVFALLMGGNVLPRIREGKVRCRGVFQQEIIASAFGGTLIPFFVWLWTTSKAKIAAIAGLVGATIIMITAASSTGIGAGAVGIGTLCLWPLRKYTRWMRWGMVAGILGLALTMKAPVWFVLQRVDFVGGSTGWDRANLIDQTVRHFSSWWLVGTNSNNQWGYFTYDLCNQFVAEAVQGGLATLILFILILQRCFSRIGAAMKSEQRGEQAWLEWTIGCILCAHIAAFFGISYFDQMKYWLYVTFAMIPAATVAVQVTQPKRSHMAPGGEYRISVGRQMLSDEAVEVARERATATSARNIFV